MSNGSSGAVFFLGTRAHYQVLDQPDKHDAENGNGPQTHQNSVQTMWQYDNCPNGDTWNYCDGDVQNNYPVSYESDKSEPGIGVKRRVKRRQSEAQLCEEEMKPAALNHVEDGSDFPKQKPRRVSLLACLWSLARRKPRLDAQPTHLQHLQSALNGCTYRESCRCLDCQSRYFECDDDSEYDYSDDSDFLNYASYASPDLESGRYQPEPEEYEDDEVFDETIPEDNASTDLLLEGREKMSISSDTLEGDEDALQLEVAAGTPLLLNHLLTHPIACVIQ